MNITVAKVISKTKHPYIVPARYSTTTCYRVWADDALVYDGVDPNYKLLTKKQVLAWIERKFEVIFNPKDVKNYGTITSY